MRASSAGGELAMHTPHTPRRADAWLTTPLPSARGGSIDDVRSRTVFEIDVGGASTSRPAAVRAVDDAAQHYFTSYRIETLSPAAASQASSAVAAGVDAALRTAVRRLGRPDPVELPSAPSLAHRSAPSPISGLRAGLTAKEGATAPTATPVHAATAAAAPFVLTRAYAESLMRAATSAHETVGSVVVGSVRPPRETDESPATTAASPSHSTKLSWEATAAAPEQQRSARLDGEPSLTAASQSPAPQPQLLQHALPPPPPRMYSALLGHRAAAAVTSAARQQLQQLQLMHAPPLQLHARPARPVLAHHGTSAASGFGTRAATATFAETIAAAVMNSVTRHGAGRSSSSRASRSADDDGDVHAVTATTGVHSAASTRLEAAAAAAAIAALDSVSDQHGRDGDTARPGRGSDRTRSSRRAVASADPPQRRRSGRALSSGSHSGRIGSVATSQVVQRRPTLPARTLGGPLSPLAAQEWVGASPAAAAAAVAAAAAAAAASGDVREPLGDVAAIAGKVEVVTTATTAPVSIVDDGATAALSPGVMMSSRAAHDALRRYSSFAVGGSRVEAATDAIAASPAVGDAAVGGMPSPTAVVRVPSAQPQAAVAVAAATATAAGLQAPSPVSSPARRRVEPISSPVSVRRHSSVIAIAGRGEWAAVDAAAVAVHSDVPSPLASPSHSVRQLTHPQPQPQRPRSSPPRHSSSRESNTSPSAGAALPNAAAAPALYYASAPAPFLSTADAALVFPDLSSPSRGSDALGGDVQGLRRGSPSPARHLPLQTAAPHASTSISPAAVQREPPQMRSPQSQAVTHTTRARSPHARVAQIRTELSPQRPQPQLPPDAGPQQPARSEQTAQPQQPAQHKAEAADTGMPQQRNAEAQQSLQQQQLQADQSQQKTEPAASAPQAATAPQAASAPQAAAGASRPQRRSSSRGPPPSAAAATASAGGASFVVPGAPPPHPKGDEPPGWAAFLARQAKGRAAAAWLAAPHWATGEGWRRPSNGRGRSGGGGADAAGTAETPAAQTPTRGRSPARRAVAGVGGANDGRGALVVVHTDTQGGGRSPSSGGVVDADGRWHFVDTRIVAEPQSQTQPQQDLPFPIASAPIVWENSLRGSAVGAAAVKHAAAAAAVPSTPTAAARDPPREDGAAAAPATPTTAAQAQPREEATAAVSAPAAAVVIQQRGRDYRALAAAAAAAAGAPTPPTVGVHGSGSSDAAATTAMASLRAWALVSNTLQGAKQRVASMVASTGAGLRHAAPLPAAAAKATTVSSRAKYSDRTSQSPPPPPSQSVGVARPQMQRHHHVPSGRQDDAPRRRADPFPSASSAAAAEHRRRRSSASPSVHRAPRAAGIDGSTTEDTSFESRLSRGDGMWFDGGLLPVRRHSRSSAGEAPKPLGRPAREGPDGWLSGWSAAAAVASRGARAWKGARRVPSSAASAEEDDTTSLDTSTQTAAPSPAPSPAVAAFLASRRAAGHAGTMVGLGLVHAQQSSSEPVARPLPPAAGANPILLSAGATGTLARQTHVVDDAPVNYPPVDSSHAPRSGRLEIAPASPVPPSLPHAPTTPTRHDEAGRRSAARTPLPPPQLDRAAGDFPISPGIRAGRAIAAPVNVVHSAHVVLSKLAAQPTASSASALSAPLSISLRPGPSAATQTAAGKGHHSPTRPLPAPLLASGGRAAAVLVASTPDTSSDRSTAPSTVRTRQLGHEANDSGGEEGGVPRTSSAWDAAALGRSAAGVAAVTRVPFRVGVAIDAPHAQGESVLDRVPPSIPEDDELSDA